jgi:regulator of replication initiation timing
MIKQVECNETERVITELMMEIAQLREEIAELRVENQLLHNTIQDINNNYFSNDVENTDNEYDNWEDNLAQAYKDAGYEC